MFEFYEEASPLIYPRSDTVNRFGLLAPDLEQVPYDPHDVYFAETTRTVKRGPSGRPYKNPKLEITPGAQPGTIGFVDWHVMAPGIVYIDFMKVRFDWRRHGAGTELVREFYKHVLVRDQIRNVHWGAVVSQYAWKIYMKMEKEYPSIHHSGRVDY